MRTFGRPDSFEPEFNSDLVYPVTNRGVTDAQFKAKADIAEGVNGQARILTLFDNTETQSNAIAPKSILTGGFDLTENAGQGEPGTGNAGIAKHWVRK